MGEMNSFNAILVVPEITRMYRSILDQGVRNPVPVCRLDQGIEQIDIFNPSLFYLFVHLFV